MTEAPVGKKDADASILKQNGHLQQPVCQGIKLGDGKGELETLLGLMSKKQCHANITALACTHTFKNDV